MYRICIAPIDVSYPGTSKMYLCIAFVSLPSMYHIHVHRKCIFVSHLYRSHRCAADHCQLDRQFCDWWENEGTRGAFWKIRWNISDCAIITAVTSPDCLHASGCFSNIRRFQLRLINKPYFVHNWVWIFLKRPWERPQVDKKRKPIAITPIRPRVPEALEDGLRVGQIERHRAQREPTIWRAWGRDRIRRL